jgi:hypothetical protein
MSRRLFNIASVLCLVVCVALMTMWVRSDWRCDLIQVSLPNWNLVNVRSARGLVDFRVKRDPMTEHISYWRVQNDPDDWNPEAKSAFGIQVFFDSKGSQLLVPFWKMVLTSGAVAMLLRIRGPRLFTEAGLIIAMAFVVLILAMRAWLD